MVRLALGASTLAAVSTLLADAGQERPLGRLARPALDPVGPADRGDADPYRTIEHVAALLGAGEPAGRSREARPSLQRHLRDVSAVLRTADVRQRQVPGGLDIVVTASGDSAEGVRQLVAAHARQLDRIPGWSARWVPLAGGARLTVLARDGGDARAVSRIRALGFVGLVTIGAHREVTSAA